MSDSFAVYMRHGAPRYCRELECWIVTQYSDTRAALLDSRLTFAPLPIGAAPESAEWRDFAGSIYQWNALPTLAVPIVKEHLRPAFSLCRIEREGPWIHEIARHLAQSLVSQGGGDFKCDFSDSFAAEAVCHVMGLPQAAGRYFRYWMPGSTETHESSEQAVRLFRKEYAHAAHIRRLDLAGVSSAVHVDDRGCGDDSADDGVAAMAFTAFFMISSVLTTGMSLLLRRSRQLARIRRNPSLISAMVEEVLRFDGPEFFAPRIAASDVEISGKTIQGGESILLAQGLANRDPSAFVRPEVFSMDRTTSKALLFTGSPYSELCATMTRSSVEIAFEEFIGIMPNLHLAGEILSSNCRPVGNRVVQLPFRSH
ncbi:cytochrome P450 [Streptomyces chryseus]